MEEGDRYTDGVQACAGYRISRVETHQSSPTIGRNDHTSQDYSVETPLTPTVRQGARRGRGGRGEGDWGNDPRSHSSRGGRFSNDTRRGNRGRRRTRSSNRASSGIAADRGSGWDRTHGSSFGSPSSLQHATTGAAKPHHARSRHITDHHSVTHDRYGARGESSTSTIGPKSHETRVDKGRDRKSYSPLPTSPIPPPRSPVKEESHCPPGNLTRFQRTKNSSAEYPSSRLHHSKLGEPSDPVPDPLEVESAPAGFTPRPTSVKSTRDTGQGSQAFAAVDSYRGYVKGTCTLMCPAEETREREEEGALSIFEATGETRPLHFRQRRADPARTVKKYRRSGAGRDMHRPEELRPLATLLSTVRYLVRDVFAKVCAGDDDWLCEHGGRRVDDSPLTFEGAYAFVEDRLRAVRQDLTVQGLGATPEGLEVLKITANFYVVSGYLMSEKPVDVFDPHLHARELGGVFASLSEMYLQAREARVQPMGVLDGEEEYLCLQALHALATTVSRETNRDAALSEAVEGKGLGHLVGSMARRLSAPLELSRGQGRGLTKAAWEPSPSCGGFSGGILRDVGQGTGEHGNFSIPLRRFHPKVAMVVELLGALGAGNWTEFFRILGSKPAIGGRDGACAPVGGEAVQSPFALRVRCLCYGMLLPVRVHALSALNRSLSKGERVSLSYLRGVLHMKSVEHVGGLCRALSLPVEGDQEHVVFKSVPVRWRSDRARRSGYLGSDENDQSLERSSRGSALGREDEWVGLDAAWLGSVERVFSRRESSPPCEACAGYGCSWCQDSTQDSRESDVRGLWGASLAPC